MVVADLLPIDVSPTVPQAVYFLGQEQDNELNLGTPRYGWSQNPDHDCLASELRVFAEAAVLGDEGIGEGNILSQFNLEDAQIELSPFSTLAGTCTGTGYRSPYRITPACRYLPFPAMSCASWVWSLQGQFVANFRLTSLSIPSKPWFEEVSLHEFEGQVAKAFQGLSSSAALRHVVESIASSLAAISQSAYAKELDDGEPLKIVEQETHVSAIRWLEEHVGLSQVAIADLLGVSRQTVQNWLRGGEIRDENRQRLLAVREILQRAQRRHPGEGALKTWLDIPQGLEARTPRQLLVNNEIGKARALALSTVPPPPRVAPQWLRDAPPDRWTQRQQHRQERVVPEHSEPDLDLDGANDG